MKVSIKTGHKLEPDSMIQVELPEALGWPEVGTKLDCTVRIADTSEENLVKGEIYLDGTVRLYDILTWYNGVIEDQ